jgi:hypothetical protein
MGKAATWANRSLTLVSILFATQVHAQSSTELTVGDPQRTYYSFKRSFAAVPAWRIIGDEEERIIRLASCVSAAEALGTDAGARFPLTKELAELAFDVLYIQGVLTRGQYPRSLWANDLELYERQQLEEIIGSRGRTSANQRRWATALNEAKPSDPMITALAQKLNSYRTTRRELKRVASREEGCGDMMAPVVRIQTVPDARRIQYITSHFVDLCTDQGIDFRDEIRCRYWTDYTAGLMLRGIYTFAVTWHSGARAYRNFNFDKLQSEDGKFQIKVQQ